MDILFFIILGFFILSKLFTYCLEYLNYIHLKKNSGKVPPELSDKISAEKLKEITDYSVDKIKFGIIESLFSFTIIAIFIFGGLIDFYNSWIISLNFSGPLNFLYFFLILYYLITLINVPFDIYKSFVIEDRYSFNTMKFRTWFFDFLKNLVVSTILIFILSYSVYYLISFLPSSWWFYVWIFFLFFSLLLMYISPYVIEPLFNKFTPIEDEDLINKLKYYSRKCGIKINKIQKMDASKRTKHTNAYFAGIGKEKRIVLYDTTLEKMDNNEIASIVAHEAGHWKKKHILKNIILIQIISISFLFVAYYLTQTGIMLDIFDIQTKPNIANTLYLPVNLLLIFFVFNIILFPIFPLFASLTRKFERQADQFAVQIVGTSKYLISSLIKLSSDNLSNLYPHPLYEKFNYSHPSLLKRIKYLKNIDKNKKF